MAKKITLLQIKNWRGINEVIKNGVDKDGNDRISPATVKDSIEGFLIFLNMSFRTTMAMNDWKIINRINKRVLDAEDKSILILEDNEYDWLLAKLEEVPPKSALNPGIDNVDSYGGIAFGADIIPILEALHNIVGE